MNQSFRMYRSPRAILSAGAAALMLAAGCAPAPGQHVPGTPRDALPGGATPASLPADPFQVASQWAARLNARPPTPAGSRHPLPDEITRITDAWTSAALARLWAQGDEYRALIIQKGTAEQGPAVLLRLGTDARGAWQVIGLEPAAATLLWSRL